MASPAVARPEAALRLPLQKDEFGDRVSKLGTSRYDTVSTTSSGVSLPPGHWTVPISGNCPRCHHHHRSINVHIKNADNSNGILDVHCEKCNKLWIGPGGRNSTRVSLASVETVDPPPLEPEARTTLVHMIRNATRVATLSPTLPGIPEIGTSFSRGPSIRESSGVRAPEDHIPSTTYAPSPIVHTVSESRVSNSRRVPEVNADINTIRLRGLITSLKRKLGTSRLGRIPLLTKWFGETQITVNEFATRPPQGPVVINNASPASFRNLQGSAQHGAAQASLAKETESVNLHAPRSQDRDTPSDTVDQDTINQMSPDERIALLRSQINPFSAQYNSRPVSSSKSSSSGHQEQTLDALATIAAIHNSLLAGVGDGFGQYNYNMDYFRDPNSAVNAQPLHISDTRTSEAATIVNGQSFASDNLLREVLHRAYRLSGPARPPSVESGWEQSRRAMGHIRDSSESSTAHHHSAAPGSSGTSNLMSGQPLAHASSSNNAEAPTPAAQLPDAHQSHTDTVQAHDRSDVAPGPPHS